MEILQIYKASNLPISGTVDIRNYPAVRQQIMAVVRRTAEAQSVPAAAGGVAAPLNRRPLSGSRSWRNCMPAARSRRPSTPRRGKKSSTISEQTRRLEHVSVSLLA